MTGDTHLLVVSDRQQSPFHPTEADFELTAGHLLKVSCVLTAPFT
jgi:hypothetical protein